MTRSSAFALVAALALGGCAGVRTGAEALVLNGQVNLCRIIVTDDVTYRLCRTHPSVTPEVLAEAQRTRAPEESLPMAIARVTRWAVYGL